MIQNGTLGNENKYQWTICDLHVICTLKYSPDHCRLSFLQPFLSDLINQMDVKSRQ